MFQSQTPENFEIVAESASVQETESNKRQRSVVWKHFHRVNPRTVHCNYCADPFTHDKGMGTTHLHRHLEKACKSITQEQRELYNESKNDSLFQSADFVFDPELTRDLMSLLFIDAEIPFATIDSRFWDPAMKSLNPAYNSVGRQTLRNDCVEVFKNGMEVSLREFEELDSRVCFTSDIWTSSVNLGYLCLTAHYIDKDFNFRKKIIAFKQISYPHTGLAIANMVEKILIDWKLDTYLGEALVSLEEEDFNILQWWKKNSELYPTLARMARDFLAVQVSSVASESAFSGAGRLTDNLRSSLSPQTIEALVCSKDWFGPNDSTFDLDQFRPFMRSSKT